MLALAFGIGFARDAQSQVLDSVDIAREVDRAAIRIRFVPQIQYLRHVPTNRGMTIQVYFQIAGAQANLADTVYDELRGPPTLLAPPFRVIYRAQGGVLQRRIDVLFEREVQFELRPEDNRTILITLPLTREQIEKPSPPAAAPEPFQLQPPPAKPREPPPLPPPATTSAASDNDRLAAPLVEEARAALARNDYTTATELLNRALNIPDNAFSQEAQELVGYAREGAGEFAKARAEYEFYVKLYPDSEGARRVRDRLAVLAAPAITEPTAAVPPRSPWTRWGSLSQYYYGGQSRADSTITTVTPATGATVLDTSNLNARDQSQLITNADFTARYRQGDWDNRFVYRDQYNASFLANQDSTRRLSNLFAEGHYLPGKFLARVGRINGLSEGVLGRFDGAYVNWGFGSRYGASGVAGQLVDTPTSQKKPFFGAAIEADRIFNSWSGNVYAIRQTISGATDRAAIGSEVRYFDPQRLLYGVIDYDTSFRALNIASLQGTWQLATGTTFNGLYDYRRTPTLQLTNATLADPSQAIGDLIDTLGTAATRAQAKALTPISKVLLASVTQQLNPIWQLGFDYRLSSLSAIPTTGTVTGTAGTGNVNTYTLQLVGNGAFLPQDIFVGNVAFLHGKLLSAQQLSLDWRIVKGLLSVEPLLRGYWQKDSQGVKLTRWTPGLKVVYQFRGNFAVEAEYDYEHTRTSGEIIDEVLRRQYWYVGYRWDF
jgi:hypothetical protein